MKNYLPDPDLLQKRNILITGAGDGIGKIIAQTYAKYGANVILLGRTESKLKSVYQKIKSLDYPTPTIIPMNLENNDYKDYQSIATNIEKELGSLHGLVHNAGLLGTLCSIEQYDPDLWEQVMHVNVKAQFLLTKALLPVLRKADTGSIIFTTSSVGNKGRASWGAYSVSKFATEGLMQVLANEEENSSSLRINAINPGRTRTSMRATAYPAEDPMTLLTPEDIMPIYLYLMGKDSRSINGQRFNAQNG